MNKSQAKIRIAKLIKEIEELRYRYHVLDDPAIDDEIYDSLERELEELEKKFPELKRNDSPLQRIGGKALEKFEKVEHQVRQWSFNDAFVEEDLHDWEERILKILEKSLGKRPRLEYVCELKIDGLHTVLTYEQGELKLAATRGDGKIGENVTSNIKTIQSIPLSLKKAVNLVVEGEIWLSAERLKQINKQREKTGQQAFANPRNAAAGTIRQLDSRVVAERKLDSFVYDISASRDLALPVNQKIELDLLKSLGFKVNSEYRVCNSISEVISFWKKWEVKKKTQDYWLDGIVIKVNQRKFQDILGWVGKAPRWAIAFKFPAEKSTAQVEDIQIQIGRHGTLTPVAYLSPVKLAGTVVRRATLHNIDQIERLGLKIGDTVVVQKAGDIIPEVVEVLLKLRTGKEKTFVMPENCPMCGGRVAKKKIFDKKKDSSADYFCQNKNCFAIQVQKIKHFVSKKAFDIDGLGGKIVEQLLSEKIIKDAADLFTLTQKDLLPLERFAEKSVINTLQSIENSKIISFNKFVYALGVVGVGEETSSLLTEIFSDFESLKKADLAELESLSDIGPVVAKNIHDYFQNEKNQAYLDKLLSSGISIKSKKIKKSTKLAGLTFVITGTFLVLTREEIKAKINQLGGKIASAVSGSTNYLLVGDRPGSKLNKAESLGIKIINEEKLKQILKS